MKPYMSKDEIRRRHKDGASLTTLAELNGCKPEDIKDLIKEARRGRWAPDYPRICLILGSARRRSQNITD